MLRFSSLFLLAFLLSLTAFAQNIHEEVNQYILKHDFKQAEKIASEAVRKNPDDIHALCALACVFRNRAYNQIINLDTHAMGISGDQDTIVELQFPHDLEKYLSSKVVIDTQLFARAESLYYQIIKIDPTYENAYFNLINTYEILPDFEKYFQVFDLFIKNLGDSSDSIKWQLLELAGKLFNDGWYEEAGKAYQKILHRFPDFTEAQSDYGAYLVTKGKIHEAGDIFRKVFQNRPEDILNAKNYYLTTVYQENFDQAFLLKQEIANREKNDISHLFDLALLAFLTNRDYKSYLQQYLKFRKQEPSFQEDFWSQLSEFLLNIEEDSLKNIVDYLEFSIEQFWNAQYDWYTIMMVNILEKFDTTAFCILRQAGTFDRLQYLEKTVQYLNNILELEKKGMDIMPDEYIWYNLGRIYFVHEKYSEALTYLLKSHRLNPESPMINYLVGLTYLKLQDRDNARKYFEMNLKMNNTEEKKYIDLSREKLKSL